MRSVDRVQASPWFAGGESRGPASGGPRRGATWVAGGATPGKPLTHPPRRVPPLSPRRPGRRAGGEGSFPGALPPATHFTPLRG
jgi:hypothetical protein